MGAAPPRTATTPPRTTTLPPPNGGNCSIRGATRRRHAVARLLMVQNPHRQRCAALLKGQRARASPGATCFPITPLANGGKCTMRGARSSSPHVEGATKRGELHHERRDTPATRRGKASNGAKPPSPQTRFVDPVSNTRLATSRRHSGVKRRRVPRTGTSLSAGTHTRLTKCQQHKPNRLFRVECGWRRLGLLR